MYYGIENARMLDAGRVFLDFNNLRFPSPVDTEDEAIEWLCDHEDVYTLARDICEIGLNPLELVAVIKQGDNAYFAPEGNRRLCAIRLLNDPDRAPAKMRAKFTKLAEKTPDIKQLFCVEFPDRDSVQIWLDRIHGGKDEGRGRSPWSSDVKARRTQSSSSRSNQLPLALLDHGIEKSLISEDDTRGKLAIIQRFSGNPVFRNKLGITKEGDGFNTDLPDEDFNALLGRLFTDVVEKEFKAHEFDAERVRNYTNDDLEKVEASGERTESRAIGVDAKSERKSDTPKKPKTPTKIPSSTELGDEFFRMNNYKLQRLYYSITTINARDHCPLLYVALWSLVECLTNIDGRNSGANFVAYLSSGKLQNIGFGDGKKTRSIRDALENIQKHGNGTKHDGEAAGFNHLQLINDYQVIEKVLVKLAQDCSK